MTAEAGVQVEWRQVVGYEGLYEVSEVGQVRRVGKAARAGDGRGGGARLGRVLKPHTVNGGYLSIQLWRDGRPRMCLIHRLVAEAFIGRIAEGQAVNHRSGIKADNSRSNLELCTASENNRHAYRTGLRAAGVKLNHDQLLQVRELHRGGLGCRRLARQFGVSKATIQKVINRKGVFARGPE